MNDGQLYTGAAAGEDVESLERRLEAAKKSRKAARKREKANRRKLRELARQRKVALDTLERCCTTGRPDQVVAAQALLAAIS